MQNIFFFLSHLKPISSHGLGGLLAGTTERIVWSTKIHTRSHSAIQVPETEYNTKDNSNECTDALLLNYLTEEFMLFNQTTLCKAANDKSRLEELAKECSNIANEDHRSQRYATTARDRCAV
ncbi:hypothetical protein CEXT_509511 [Caerostris extrusa]|uniref:Uncharacterized protein n=1 Tax=Caerostris extrusa TaxID=172846 RepID=A0AAV4YDS9_CAEEX|nr:hypothetical protein CEXT_509511 [Caerostris extrusa]